ncbi:hypothetical protein DFH07DRAFT_793457 [Mycena maculata]|uniref:Uncharacterized protein n=1 Tax=Mycena maculata TaxID=230809 RepID=A0AAD7NY79_9AGAR|nr:hypothetical protein DFH07DRAFT_793457 [Mycena maculata]
MTSIGALVPYPDPPTSREVGHSGNPERWAIILNPTPGRTLNELYSTTGQILATHANRMAYRLGLGPDVVARQIAGFFGTGEERQLRLTSLRNERSVKLERDCSRLMGYSLSDESPKTQRQAFERIVTLSTRFPDLRPLFLGAKCMQGVSIFQSDISAFWDRSDSSLDSEWSFWRTFAATCLSETDIAVILEELPVSQRANCSQNGGGLSAIERLLIAHNCQTGAESIFSRALCIRYLAGILELPGFWMDSGSVYNDVAKKLCLDMVRILKDIAIDTLPSDESPKLEAPFDYEGIDILAEAILVGMSNWLREMDFMNRALQPWYAGFREAVQLLRRPLAAALLPNSFSLATSSSFEKDLPHICREVEFDVLVESSTNTTPADESRAPVAGLYYAEHFDIPGQESRAHGSASPEQAVDLSVPHETMVTSGVAFENDSQQFTVAQEADFSVLLEDMMTSGTSFKNTEPTQQFTIAILGASAVGKTALTSRLIHDVFVVDEFDPTIENRYRQPIKVDGESSSLEILDTGAADTYTFMIDNWIESAQGFILVFSLTEQVSLEEVVNFRRKILKLKGPDSPIVVVGTKSDFVSKREVSAATIESLARTWDLPFYETSAKHNWRVKDVFKDVVRQMRRLPPNAATEQKKEQKLKKWRR